MNRTTHSVEREGARYVPSLRKLVRLTLMVFLISGSEDVCCQWEYANSILKNIRGGMVSWSIGPSQDWRTWRAGLGLLYGPFYLGKNDTMIIARDMTIDYEITDSCITIADTGSHRDVRSHIERTNSGLQMTISMEYAYSCSHIDGPLGFGSTISLTGFTIGPWVRVPLDQWSDCWTSSNINHWLRVHAGIEGGFMSFSNMPATLDTSRLRLSSGTALSIEPKLSISVFPENCPHLMFDVSYRYLKFPAPQYDGITSATPLSRLPQTIDLSGWQFGVGLSFPISPGGEW